MKDKKERKRSKKKGCEFEYILQATIKKRSLVTDCTIFMPVIFIYLFHCRQLYNVRWYCFFSSVFFILLLFNVFKQTWSIVLKCFQFLVLKRFEG